jgi:hypothetical protein
MLIGLESALLLCGIMAIIGVFLKWVEVSAFGMSMSVSGFDMRRANGDYVWMVLIGGSLIVLFALLALVSSSAKEDKKGLTQFGMLVLASALVTIGGGIWFLNDISDANANFNMFGGMGSIHASSGFYMSFAAAIIAFIFAIVIIVLSRGRAPVAVREFSADIAAPPAGTASSVREYYEKKGASSVQASAPVAGNTTIGISPVTTAAPPPLPPLPPTVDAAKAKECFGHACDFETAGKHEKAIEEYTKAIRLDARHSMAYFKRGLLLKTMNVKPAAISDFRRVIDISDSPELSEKAKSYIAEMK